MSDEDWMSISILIEDRVFNYVRDLPMFTFKDVKKTFPDENDKTLYRAINKLAAQGRVSEVGWHQRQKLYRCKSLSQLPSVLTRDGKYAPASDILKHIGELYSPDGQMLRLKELNDFWITVAWLFTVAEKEDAKEQRQAFFEAHNQLMDMRSSLQNLIGTIDSVVKHPSMKGDMDYFKKTFSGNDPEMPTPKEIAEFKVWLSKHRKATNASA